MVMLLAAALLLGVAGSAAAAPQPASTILPEPSYPGALTGDARSALGLPQPGSGGWFWPIGTEDFRSWAGWLAPRGGYLHVAQDMPCSYGHAVYAVGDGVVFISRADAGGYGVGGAPGGCIVITHTTAAGTRFDALYGHVSGLRVKQGERVQAGEVIARVNGCRHLHFSVHPGSKYRDRNPYAGHVPKSWADHGGYVDPVRFLKTNPRAAAYRPPALPQTEIETSSPPLRYGAADGAAYWTEEGGAGSVDWRYDLASGVRRPLDPGEAVPAFDTGRYDSLPLAAPAVGFSVGDRLPVLTLTVDHDTPRWGEDAALTAMLANAAGVPLNGAIVRLLRSSGDRLVAVALGVSDAEGTCTLVYQPSGPAALRAAFTPPPDQPASPTYIAAGSRTLVITPHAGIATPRVPPVVDRADLVTVAGDLTPRHTAGMSAVDLVFQRRGQGGRWATRLTVQAEIRDAAVGTRYVGHARLPATGLWRVRAVHLADEAHALTSSLWRTFTCR
jgi:hypothetical protein